MDNFPFRSPTLFSLLRCTEDSTDSDFVQFIPTPSGFQYLEGSFPKYSPRSTTMNTSTKGSPVDDLNALITSKSSIEDEIESQAAILRANNSTLDSPLTDRDGFPRADIDIWAVRHARVRIIRLRNDLSSLLDKIGMALEHIHASQSAEATTDEEAPLTSLLPFAKVDAVAPCSPAQLAGLRPGDLIIEFGQLTAGNVSGSLQPIAQQVERNENRPILLSVSRDKQIIAMRLTPQRGWGGRGMVGCHIVPYTTPQES